jgi:integrase
MAKLTSNALDDLTVKSAKPRDREYTLRDGSGLFLLVHPNGAKYFQLRTTLNGKPKKIQLGVYDVMTLAKAREVMRDMKKQISDGIDPTLQKKIDKASSKLNANATLEAVYLDWLSEKTISPAYNQKITSTMNANVLPRLGAIPTNQITPPLIKSTLHVMELRGCIELTKKTKSWLVEIFDHATVLGLRTGDNPANVVKIKTPQIKENHPCLKNRVDTGDFLRRLLEYSGRTEIVIAIQLLMITAVRSGELRLAHWSEFNFDDATWSVPKERMKVRKPHTVMLSRQAVELLKQLKNLTGYQSLLLPDINGIKPLSDMTFTKALQRVWMDYRIVPHGFRHLFSTQANESRLFHKDVIEAALAHGDENKIRGTYNQAEYRAERAKLAQWWSDELDLMRDGAKIIPMGKQSN